MPRSTGGIPQAINGTETTDRSKRMDMERFFSMGGYAFYVWTSYSLVLLVLLVNLVVALRRSTQAGRRIAGLIRQERHPS